jgi:peptide/nickel transport system substrate-binding protein
MLHKFNLSFRRRIRKQNRRIMASAEQTGDAFETYFIQRLGRFGKSWRLVLPWLLLMVLVIGALVVQLRSLSGYYQTRQPVAGGIFIEGIYGSFTNANPIYATNDVDKTVSNLVFSGLFKYNSKNKIVGDLASSYSVDSTGTVYTVQLRPGLQWQDGQPLTAEDVVFTYKVIQNPDAESPLEGSWQGIKVAAKSPHSVTFTLPNPLSSFIDGMTNGIVPQHLLKDVPMVGMRSVAFNTQSPIGAGPFKWRDIDVKGTNAENAEESIGLTPNEDYWAGKPKLKSYIVHAFADQDEMVKAYKKNEITSMSGLHSVPAGLSDSTQVYNFTLTAETMVFFKTSSGVLADSAVRNALVKASNPPAIIGALSGSLKPAREPLLVGQLGYNSQYVQVTDDQASANQMLEGAGWVRGPDGIRTKNGNKLEFMLSIANTAEYNTVAKTLQKQWKAVGVRMKIDATDSASFRSTLSEHLYDAVLYGITIGADPDVFVYWDSTQADIRSTNRLNFSEYKSPVADDALEAGRTRNDPALRTIKYSAFLKQWQADAPALALYQPDYLYISRVPIYGLNEHAINDPADRLYGANDWMIRTARVTND